jgi:hypothetical protein
VVPALGGCCGLRRGDFAPAEDQCGTVGGGRRRPEQNRRSAERQPDVPGDDRAASGSRGKQ